MKRITVIGGTGHFGGRICRRIAGQPDIELVVTSRSIAKANVLVDELQCSNPHARIIAAQLDQNRATFASDLNSLRPDIVIHTVGPYQGQDYRVAKACIESGSHYIDLADGREFVEGFAALHAEAERNDVLLVSGASTLPGLSSVVVDCLRARFSAIEAIEISIAPAHQTPRGLSTIAAVLSYCGKPLRVFVNGKWRTRYGWQDMTVQRYPQLGTRLSGACDVPDLGLLPKYVNGVKTVTFQAALEAKWEQIALWSMAWFGRLGLVKDWSPWLPTFQKMSSRLIGWGSQVGGMRVRISGTSMAGAAITIDWNLVARENHGPEIPCTPALILARKLLNDGISQRGAYPCLGFFSMSDFDLEVADLNIEWTIEEHD